MKLPELDSNGHLRNLADWSPEVASWLAKESSLELKPESWEIINLLREFYQRYEIAPNNRALVKWIRERCGPAKGNSIYLLTLFPENPARLVARCAGLPKPPGCL